MMRPLMRSGGRVYRAFVVVLLVVVAGAARAEDRPPALQLHAGVFNLSKSEKDVEAGVELRVPTPLWRLDATGGLTTTQDGAIWLYFGLRRDFRLGKRWLVTPGFGIAHYQAGDSKFLGGPIEFRSVVDVAYRLGPERRLGLSLYHLSNAGYYDFNPGVNSLVVTYSFDLK
jgi:hypothetical protein